jgi:hypothetical protein
MVLRAQTELGKNGTRIRKNSLMKYGHNAQKVLNEFSSLELLKVQCQGYLGSIAIGKSL